MTKVMSDEELEAIRKHIEDYGDFTPSDQNEVDCRALIAEVDRLRALAPLPIRTHHCTTTHSACECVLKDLERMREGERLAMEWLKLGDVANNCIPHAELERCVKAEKAQEIAREAFRAWAEARK